MRAMPDYGLGCPFCEGSPVEASRVVKSKKSKRGSPKDESLQTRIVCDSCGCGTPWCNSSSRAWMLWNNRFAPRPFKTVVAKIVRYDGLDMVDTRAYESEDSYRKALDECLRDGWETCGDSDLGGTHLTILRRCLC